MRVLSIAMIVALAAVAGCQRDTGETQASVAPPASQTPSSDATGAGATASDTHTSADAASPAPAPPPSPGVSLALVAAVDEYELAAVEQANGRKLSEPVREYARLLEREHGENLAAARALTSGGNLIEPETTTEVHALTGRGKATLESLANTPAEHYEHAWLQAMVEGHTEALALLDTRLIPATKDDQLRNFLNNTRDHMAMHLERGKTLLDASGAH